MDTKFFKKTDTGQYIRLSDHELYQGFISGELKDVFFLVGSKYVSWKEAQSELLEEMRREGKQ
jgi:hypothetical protein